MALHVAIADQPDGAVRPLDFSFLATQGRRAVRRNTLRAQVRGVLLRPNGRHRVTFIPLDTYSLHAD